MKQNLHNYLKYRVLPDGRLANGGLVEGPFGSRRVHKGTYGPNVVQNLPIRAHDEGEAIYLLGECALFSKSVQTFFHATKGACYKRLHPHHRGQHLGSLPGFLGCVCVCVSACLRVCLCVCVFVHGVLTDQIHASLLLSGFLVRSGLFVFLLVGCVCVHMCTR